MFVSFVHQGPDRFLFLAELCKPEEVDDLIRNAGYVPQRWYRVNPSYVDAVDGRPSDFLTLCRYAYGRGFLHTLDEQRWRFAPIPVLQRSAPGHPYEPGELSLVARLIDEMQEPDMGYLLAEARVMGAHHAQAFLPLLV